MPSPLLALVPIVLAATPAGVAAPTTAELLRHVPADAAVVVAMDAAALRDHPTVQAWLAEHQAAWSGGESDAQEFFREAGLDPLHDVDRLVAAVAPGSGSNRGLVLVGGRFDPASLGAALAKRGAQPADIGGATALRLHRGEGASARPAFVVLTRDILTCGDEEAVRASLAGAAAASPLVAEEVAAGRIDPAAPFWIVAAVPEKVRQGIDGGPEGGGEGPAAAIRGVLTASRTVTRVALQASLGDALTLTGWATADSEENAGLLRDAVKGAIAAARLQAQGQSPELVDVLRDIKVSVDGVEVQGSAVIPLALLERLAQEHQHRCTPASTVTR